jgi:hypothetical protein
MNRQREKRAFLSYLVDLLNKQKLDPESMVEGIPIQDEIKAVENYLSDLEFMINVKEAAEAG